MAKVRLSMDVSRELLETIDRIARREGVSRTEILRRGIHVVRAAMEQRDVGRPHMGFSSSSDAFDMELVGVLG